MNDTDTRKKKKTVKQSSGALQRDKFGIFKAGCKWLELGDVLQIPLDNFRAAAEFEAAID